MESQAKKVKHDEGDRSKKMNITMKLTIWATKCVLLDQEVTWSSTNRKIKVYRKSNQKFQEALRNPELQNSQEDLITSKKGSLSIQTTSIKCKTY